MRPLDHPTLVGNPSTLTCEETTWEVGERLVAACAQAGLDARIHFDPQTQELDLDIVGAPSISARPPAGGLGWRLQYVTTAPPSGLETHVEPWPDGEWFCTLEAPSDSAAARELARVGHQMGWWR